MEDTPVMSAPQALDELRTCYEAFVEKLKECRTTSMGEAVGFFFRSQGNPRVGSAVEEFNTIVTGRIAALAEQLARCSAEEAEELTRQALELMLFYPVPQDNTISFSLAAFEGHARPLVDFLPPEARLETGKRYAKRTPPRRMLNKQKKLWKELSR